MVLRFGESVTNLSSYYRLFSNSLPHTLHPGQLPCQWISLWAVLRHSNSSSSKVWRRLAGRALTFPSFTWIYIIILWLNVCTRPVAYLCRVSVYYLPILFDLWREPRPCKIRPWKWRADEIIQEERHLFPHPGYIHLERFNSMCLQMNGLIQWRRRQEGDHPTRTLTHIWICFFSGASADRFILCLARTLFNYNDHHAQTCISSYRSTYYSANYSVYALDELWYVSKPYTIYFIH